MSLGVSWWFSNLKTESFCNYLIIKYDLNWCDGLHSLKSDCIYAHIMVMMLFLVNEGIVPSYMKSTIWFRMFVPYTCICFSGYIWIYIHAFFKKKTELLFQKSFKLKIFFQNFFPMHTVLQLKCPNALLPSPSQFPKPLLLSGSICLFCGHAISIQFGLFEGWEVIYLSEALCQ